MRLTARSVGLMGATVLMLGWLAGAMGQTATSVALTGVSPGQAAVDQAAKSNRYCFIYFWKANDEQSRKMEPVFRETMATMKDAADSIGIEVSNPNERALVDRFGASRAPMPFVLAMAPCGAVTKAFPLEFTADQLRQAIVSPCTARCMKDFQDRKLVLLCVYNQQTQSNQAAWAGVQMFKADLRYGAATDVVTLDPADQTEAPFLQLLQIDPRTPQAVTVLFAPSGQALGKFVGGVTKDQLVAKVAATQSSCCPGGKCGPNGCGPAK